MFDQIELGGEFFEGLLAMDLAIVEEASREACPFCGGRLHRGDYPRKPRGGLIGKAAEAYERRFSLCCGREGCRKRATPPSVRFLGRRVYVGAVVIVASVVAVMKAAASAVSRATGIAARTTRRWLRWWRGPFTATSVFVQISSRMVPAVSRALLPASIVERLLGAVEGRVRMLLGWLLPITTVTSSSRFVRAIFAPGL
jgi:hypothetical protein